MTGAADEPDLADPPRVGGWAEALAVGAGGSEPGVPELGDHD